MLFIAAFICYLFFSKGNEKANNDVQPINGGDADDERQDGANTKILIDEDENMNENPQINGNINGYV